MLTLLNKPLPLLPQAVEHLTEGWQGGLLDLSRLLLVLPTQEARRRLHEALVRKAASLEGALLPPHWMLPMQLAEGTPSSMAPAPLEQLVWIGVIRSMSAEESRPLFPRKTPHLDPLGASELTDSIRSLRGELAQAGLGLREAVKKRPEDPRWKALLSLEERYLHRLATLGLTDRITSQLKGSQNPHLPEGINQVLVIGVPDLPKVYDGMLPLLETRGIGVTVLAYDPLQRGKEHFDPLGRPGKTWEDCPIPLGQKTIHVCLDREEEAEKAAVLVQESGGTGAVAAIGVTSTELSSPLASALERLGIPSFNPAGEPLDSLPLGRLLRNLATVLREKDFRSCLVLLRHPHILRCLKLDPCRDLEALDSLCNHLIPVSLEDFLQRLPAAKADNMEIPEHLELSLRQLLSLLQELESGEGVSPLLHTLQKIYHAVDLARISGGKEVAEWIRFYGDALTKASSGVLPEENLPSKDLLEQILSSLHSASLTLEKHPDSVELPGWLELLWEDAPHLVVAGMNDGLVPETRRDDPFLHEKLREEWGLFSDTSRLRRDSYLLLCLDAARQHGSGRLDLLVARQDEEGSLLKPSRLLLRCRDKEELPRRVLELFQDLAPRPGERWRSAWALIPKKKDPPTHLSASALRDYLACPTRFYLKHVLNLKEGSFVTEEADSQTFGILLHTTLREFGSNPELANERNAELIEKSLVAIWTRLFEARYGKNPSFPLAYQREAGIRRLRGAAAAQARLRNEGWEIVACEQSFKKFPLFEMFLNGQIDRIDRRVTAGGTEWRIIDYKSSEGEKDPDREHHRALGKRDTSSPLPPYECFEVGKKRHRWTDLQLPIYRLVLLAEMEGSNALSLGKIAEGTVEAGYFVLPAKIGKSDFLPFDALGEYASSAESCLEGVLGAIRRGVFWPPRSPKHDNFESLLFDRLEADASSGQQTLDPANLQPGKPFA